ncbi:hypothetical protein K3495_g14589, partial [Podosphaera aphanis]
LDRIEEFKIEFNYNEGELHELPPANSPGDLARHTTKTLEQDAVRYALQQWLEPRHMNIVHAWTNQFFNRNTTTTSRLEGAHAVLKRWIGTPTKKLSSVWASIQLALSDQTNEIRIKRSRARDSLPAGISGEFYYGVLGRISHFALHETCKQVKYPRNEELRTRNGQSYICTGTFNKSIGMPCWHIIQERMSQNRGLTINDFHQHWHFVRPQPNFQQLIPDPPILVPVIRQQRRTEESGRRAHARAHNRQLAAQTGRILSQHETLQPVLRHCTACVELGHDKIRCQGCRATGHTRSHCPNILVGVGWWCGTPSGPFSQVESG